MMLYDFILVMSEHVVIIYNQYKSFTKLSVKQLYYQKQRLLFKE